MEWLMILDSKPCFVISVFFAMALLFVNLRDVHALSLSYNNSTRDKFTAQICSEIDWEDMIVRLRSDDVTVRADAIEQWIVVGKIKRDDAKRLLASDTVIALIASGQYPFGWMENKGRYSREVLSVIVANGKTQDLRQNLDLIDILALEGSAFIFDLQDMVVRLFHNTPPRTSESFSCF
jgi:hypothetical protein